MLFDDFESMLLQKLKSSWNHIVQAYQINFDNQAINNAKYTICYESLDFANKKKSSVPGPKLNNIEVARFEILSLKRAATECVNAGFCIYNYCLWTQNAVLSLYFSLWDNIPLVRRVLARRLCDRPFTLVWCICNFFILKDTVCG